MDDMQQPGDELPQDAIASGGDAVGTTDGAEAPADVADISAPANAVPGKPSKSH